MPVGFLCWMVIAPWMVVTGFLDTWQACSIFFVESRFHFDWSPFITISLPFPNLIFTFWTTKMFHCSWSRWQARCWPYSQMIFSQLYFWIWITTTHHSWSSLSQMNPRHTFTFLDEPTANYHFLAVQAKSEDSSVGDIVTENTLSPFLHSDEPAAHIHLF